MKKHLIQLSLAGWLLAVSSIATALQITKPVEGQNTFVKISSKESTRFVVEGGRIREFRYKEGDLSVDKDVQRGQVFITPLTLDKPINVRIITTGNHTFSYILQPVDMPQEDVVVLEEKVRVKQVEPTTDVDERNGEIRRLIHSMAPDDPPGNLDCEILNQEVLLWSGTQFFLKLSCRDQSMMADRYSIKNTGSAVMRMVEQEFFRQGVIAVSIESQTLEPGASSRVLIIREP